MKPKPDFEKLARMAHEIGNKAMQKNEHWRGSPWCKFHEFRQDDQAGLIAMVRYAYEQGRKAK